MENNEKKYIKLENLEIYKFARQLSKIGWDVYNELSWQDKKVMGDQFITATDSFGANIVEGYSRYYYLDRIKFFYNARGSLSEACEYWLEVMYERGKVKPDSYHEYKQIAQSASLKLQNFISAIYKARNNTR